MLDLSLIFIKKLWDLVYIAFGEGGWSLKHHEQIVIGNVVRDLRQDNKTIVEKQLNVSFFVERTNPRISIIRPHIKNEHLSIPDEEFQDCLFKVKIRVDGKKQTTNVTFYKGYIFSLEFKKPKTFYKNKNIEVLSVKKGVPSDTYTTLINREEHGSFS